LVITNTKYTAKNLNLSLIPSFIQLAFFMS